MQLDRRFIALLAALACLASAPAAIGGNNPGPIHINPPSPAGSSGKSDRPLGELPAVAPCDVARLTEVLNGLSEQKAALKQELAHRKGLLEDAKARGTPESKPLQAMIAGQIEDLQRRITAIEGRELAVRNQIRACDGKADNPGSSGEEPAPANGPTPPGGSGGNNGQPAPGLAVEPTFRSGEDMTAGMRISCKVPKGEATRTVVFRNIGQKPIPSGTAVTWYVKTSGQGGQFFMPHALGVGADLTASGLLKVSVPGGASCRSKL